MTTILDVGPLSPAIGAAKLREPVTVSGDFVLHLDYSQDLTQGEFLYALGRDGYGQTLTVNGPDIAMIGPDGMAATILLPDLDGSRHSFRIRRVGAAWFITCDELAEQPMTVFAGTQTFTFDKINSAIDQPHSDPGSVIHSLRIETN